MVSLAGGPSFIGTDDPVIPSDGEGTKRPIELQPYAIGATTVTVEQFAAFVEATGYVTDAEREGTSFVFKSQVAADAKDRGGLFGTEWWRVIEGATWRNPFGTRSHIQV
ncbi:MAG: SUMF1/EgtB/PvdO family nonheme iron enzyme, partial [Pseudomonadota bacterium]